MIGRWRVVAGTVQASVPTTQEVMFLDTLCLSGCFSIALYIVVQILRPDYGCVSRRFISTSETEKSLKGCHGLFSPIVSKDEFIQVNLKVMAAYPMVCAKKPLL